MTSSPAQNAAAAPAADACRVIVVDDSLTVRRAIARLFDRDPFFRVVATAGNGMLAISALQRYPADIVVLDIDMPVMDGLTAIPQLKMIDPAVQIIMASTHTLRCAEISLRALTLGATDYIAKPAPDVDAASIDNFSRELLEKARALFPIARRVTPHPFTENKKQISLRDMPTLRPEIIALGASTGGPPALFEVIKSMGGDLPQPVVITQHMPAAFTSILAEHIARQCGVRCKEAQEGEILRPGHYYLAPGGFHMLIVRKAEGPSVKLSQDPPENYCRPAVDPMLRSVAEVYGRRVLAVILTGMGQDGYKGSQAVIEAGGAVIAQNEATSIVWGMPGAVANAGLCSAVLPVGEIGAAIKKLAMRPS